MFKLEFRPSFIKTYQKTFAKNSSIKAKIERVLNILSDNPTYPSLKSHKVQTRLFGERWSSRVTGDIRIIWDFDEENNLVILVLDIGGHSGGGKVYK